MTGWLLIHLTGVLLAVGNMIVTAFWKIRADAQKNPTVIHYATKNVMLADYVFTLPGIVLIFVSGIVMAEKSGMLTSDLNWITLSIILFGITGVLWGLILIPVQRKMIRQSLELMKNEEVEPQYQKSSLLWAVVGILATIIPILIMYLMVMKPF